MTSNTITNSSDVIDVRDVIARVEELEESLTERHEEGQFASGFYDWILNSRDNSDPIYAAFGDDGSEVQRNIEEYYKLHSLLSDLKGNGGDEQWRGDWYPVTLIRDSYFKEYAMDLAEDINGDAISAAMWPLNCVDWDRAARELRMDYSSVEFDGVTYWYR